MKGAIKMKKLITKDGYIELDNQAITLLGAVAHDVYFNLLRLYRETLNLYDQDKLQNCVFDFLNDEQVMDLQEILEIV